MKDKKAKFLIVNASEITRQLYKVDEEHVLGKLFLTETITSDLVFNMNNIPEEFQKLIIKINIPFFLYKEGEEYITGLPFDLTGGKITKENGKKYIEISNCPMQYGYFIDNNVKLLKIKTELKHRTYEDVQTFIKKLQDNNLLKEYFMSINQLFYPPLDLNNKNNKTLKLGNQKSVTK